MLSLNLVYGFLAALIMAMVFIPLSKFISWRTGCVGLDVHKKPTYHVPKLGGFIILAGVLSGFTLFSVLEDSLSELTAFLGSSLIAAVIGVYEDFREINPVVKPALIALAGLPVVLLGVYSPTPEIPFVGRTRLTIVYPILIIVGYAVVCNAVNSIDVLNGSMALSVLAALIPLSLVSYIKGHTTSFALSLIFAASLLVFLTQNMYPSKVFAGNVGSLFAGAVLTFIAVNGALEVVTIIAIMPMIMNEFHVIYSLGGLRSGKQNPVRPVVIESDLIMASRDRKAPITLLRLFTAGRGLREPEAVKMMAAASLYSSLLSLLTYFLFLR